MVNIINSTHRKVKVARDAIQQRKHVSQIRAASDSKHRGKQITQRRYSFKTICYAEDNKTDSKEENQDSERCKNLNYRIS